MSRSDEFNTSRTTTLIPQPAALSLIVSTGLLSWFAMMIVHESGHVLAAWLSGGEVVKVVLHPLAISRTDVAPNPHPLFVVWGGPIWGSILPLAAFWFGRSWKFSATYMLAFFAGFCLIANGAYIGVGFWYPVGDALDLRQLGTPPIVLALFGVGAITAGLWMWNGLGKHFGIGPNRLPVSWKTALAMMAIVVFIATTEWALSERI